MIQFLQFLTRRKLLVFLSLLIVLFRVPSLYDYWWYLDENMYFTIGYVMNNGQQFMVNAWDNKPPFVAIFYSILYFFFGNSIIWYRVMMIFMTILALWFFDSILKNMFDFKNQKIKNIGLCIFAFFLIYSWEMSILNAELIFMPLILGGLALYFHKTDNPKVKVFEYFISGCLFSMAAFSKMQSLFEVLNLILLLFILQFLSYKENIVNYKIKFKNYYYIFCILLAVIIPYFTLLTYCYFTGYLPLLKYTLIGFSNTYLSTNNPLIFGNKIEFISTLGFRAILYIFLILSLIYFRFKNYFNNNTFIIYFWLLIVFFTTTISDRNYPHYLIQLYPALSLFILTIFIKILENHTNIFEKTKYVFTSILIINTFLIHFSSNAPIVNYNKNRDKEYIKYILNKMTRSEFNSRLVPTSGNFQNILIPIIQKYSKPLEIIYLLTNSAEVYPLSNRLPAYRHINDFQLDITGQNLYQLISDKTSLIIIDKNSPAYADISSVINQKHDLKEKVDRFEVWLKK